MSACFSSQVLQDSVDVNSRSDILRGVGETTHTHEGAHVATSARMHLSLSSKVRSSFAPAVLALLATACGHSLEYVSTQGIGAAPRKRDPRLVEVLTAGPPQRPFREAGSFEIEQQSAFSAGSRTMIAKLQSKAAEIGCDAIVVGQVSSTSSTGTLVGSAFATSPSSALIVGGTYGVRGHRAACLVYTDMNALAMDPGNLP